MQVPHVTLPFVVLPAAIDPSNSAALPCSVLIEYLLLRVAEGCLLGLFKIVCKRGKGNQNLPTPALTANRMAPVIGSPAVNMDTEMN